MTLTRRIRRLEVLGILILALSLAAATVAILAYSLAADAFRGAALAFAKALSLSL